MDAPVRPEGEDRLDGRFEQLVVDEIPVLLRAARAMAGQDAEDVVQDTLVRAYRAIDSFDGRHPRAWLLTIMRNVVYSRWRRGPRDVPIAVVDVDPHGVAPSAEDAALDRALDADLDDALRALPEHQRRTVLLVDVEGLSMAEAAALLGVRPGTVMSRTHRARKRMRAHLESRGRWRA